MDSILDYINHLVEGLGYSEEYAEICADLEFSDDYNVEDDSYKECDYDETDWENLDYTDEY